MNPDVFEISDRFRCAVTVDDAFQAFSVTVAQLGYQKYFYTQLFAPNFGEVQGVSTHTTFDPDYIAEYNKEELYNADYVVDHVTKYSHPLLWTDMLSNLTSAHLGTGVKKTMQFVWDNNFRSSVTFEVHKAPAPSGMLHSLITLLPDTATPAKEHVEAFAENRTMLATNVAFLEQAASPSKISEEFYRLTDTERTILDLLCCGYQMQRISDTLGLGDRTAAHHLASLRKKLNAKTNAQCVAVAFRIGLL